MTTIYDLTVADLLKSSGASAEDRAASMLAAVQATEMIVSDRPGPFSAPTAYEQWEHRKAAYQARSYSSPGEAEAHEAGSTAPPEHASRRAVGLARAFLEHEHAFSRALNDTFVQSYADRLKARALEGALRASMFEELVNAISPEWQLRAVVLSQVIRECAELVATMPVRNMVERLQAADRLTTMSQLLAESALEHTVADVSLEAARTRGAVLKVEWLQAAGGALKASEVARRLGLTRPAVDKRRARGALLAVPLPSGDWGYPARQFSADGPPLAGLEDVLSAMAVDDPWAQLQELVVPTAFLDGQSALDVLEREGADALPRVLVAVQQAGRD